MLRLTVSGLPGSGTSTLVALLEETLGIDSMNGGDVFRDEAARRGLSVQEFSAVCRAEPEVDRQLDELLKRCMTDQDGPGIVESRLAGWWALRLELDVHRVWIEVDEVERMRRIVDREGGAFAERTRENRSRAVSDRRRYLELYDIDISDLTPYSIIIDSTSLSAAEVSTQVLNRMEAET